jgi:hypothetical protein
MTNVSRLPIVPCYRYQDSKDQYGRTYGQTAHESGAMDHMRMGVVVRYNDMMVEARCVLAYDRDFCGGTCVSSVDTRFASKKRNDDGSYYSHHDNGIMDGARWASCSFSDDSYLRIPNIADDSRIVIDSGEELRQYALHCLAHGVLSYNLYCSRVFITARDRSGGRVERLFKIMRDIDCVTLNLVAVHTLMTDEVPQPARNSTLPYGGYKVPCCNELSTVHAHNINSSNDVVSLTLAINVEGFVGEEGAFHEDLEEWIDHNEEGNHAGMINHGIMDKFLSREPETAPARSLRVDYWYCG